MSERRIEHLDLSQYFGLWAVEPVRFRQMVDAVKSMDLTAHIRANAERDDRPLRVDLEQSIPSASGRDAVIAVLRIEGTMTKRGSSLGAGSTVLLRQEMRAAARDETVDAILLVIDSPGGTVAGTADLAEEVRSAGHRKPVYAFVEDLCCSAAYWVAAQARQVYANDRSAIVGSIGTYMGIYDESERFALEGIKPVLLTTGQHKGAGFPGTEITDAQRSHFQQIVDETQQSFADAVIEGRGLTEEEFAQLADGRVWLADKAEALRLIDGVQSLDATLAELATEAMSAAQAKESVPAMATVAELKAACPGATPEFLVKQLEAGATVDAAKDAWMREQQRMIETLRRSEDREENEDEGNAGKSRKGRKNRRGRSRAEEEDDTAAEDETETDDEEVAEEEEPEAEEDDPESEEDEKDTAARHRGLARRRHRRTRYGVKPLPTNGKPVRSQGDPAEEFRAAVADKVAAGMDRKSAVAAVAKEQPELREAFVASHNAMHAKVRR